MKRLEALILQVLVLSLICMCVAATLFAIGDLPPFSRRDLASLTCFTGVSSAPGSEAPISAPSSSPPGQAAMAARAHPFEETTR